MQETLREVSKNLWVSDFESARMVEDDFTLVVDCTGRAPDRWNGISIPPTGITNHYWTVEDLNRITIKVSARLRAGKPVLIHCSRGVSRSVTAAAAVLLDLGRAHTVKDALAKTMYPGTKPNAHSIAGLKEWWDAQIA